MMRLTLAVLLLSLEVSAQPSATNARKVRQLNEVGTTGQYWSQTSSTPLKMGTPGSVTLTPCPPGVDYTSGVGYDVYINDANPESVAVTSGSTGAGNCSISFTPNFSHSNYTIGSASSGIQETINVFCGVSSTYYKNRQCNITIPGEVSNPTANNYNVYGTIFFHSNNSILSGYGVVLKCSGRGACLQVGDLSASSDYVDNTITGLNLSSTNHPSLPAYAGVNVTNTVRSSGVVVITTATAHGFRPGDMVTTLFTDNSAYWGDAVVATVPSTTTFTYARTGVDIAPQATPGVVALAYSAILDNGENTHFLDVTNSGGWFNNFFDMWDDENATIDHFKTASADVNHGPNWSGSIVFSAGNQDARHQIAPVISLLNSTITSSANGVTVYNSNGLYIENTIIQGTSLWEVHSSNETGNYQGAYLKNIYSETDTNANPLIPPRSPFPGLGIAGLIAGASSGAASFHITGNGGTLGAFPTGGTGSMGYSYFIVANDTTAGTQTSPMQILNWLSTGSDSIPVRWPRVANGADAITYDVLRMATPAGVGAIFPFNGGCTGGPGGTCGYVAKGLTQSIACSGSLVCSHLDDGGSSTSAYTIKQANYVGTLNFWPGSIVSVDKSVLVDTDKYGSVGIGLNGNPLQVANLCPNYGATSPGGYTTCLASVTSFNNSVPNQTATIMTDGSEVGSGMKLSKGRLNFSNTPGAYVSAHHIITLLDSQPALTQATWGFRPPANANDTWIGTDLSGVAYPNSGQLAFGAPVSITNYIRATGDGIHSDWLERLTSKQKTFAVPVTIRDGNSFTLGDGSPLSQMKIYNINSIPAHRVSSQSCFDIVGEAKGLTKADKITGITPPGTLGNLSLNAYPANEGAITLHFCNPSGSDVTTPSGIYSFLAVR
jgi:hypothetical protein